MKKYLLALCTIFVHNLSTDAYVTIPFDNLSIDNDNLVDEEKIYTKKGGVHSATWYNPHGARTASGLKFHKDSLTAAYNYSKMGTYLRVTNIVDSISVIVKVTDRMGNKSKNIIDLSKCAFDSIGNPRSGRIKVIVEEISIK